MTTPPASSISFALRGPSGEPVDFRRTALSHGLANVVPFAAGEEGERLTTVVRLSGGGARAVELRPSSGATCSAEVSGPALGTRETDEITITLRRMLALDSDLAPFYVEIADDPLLSWARHGAGRMVRSQTVFEDVIRTICTTNCSFSATRRMIETSVAELGDIAEPGRRNSADGDRLGSESDPAERRTFPTAERIAQIGSNFFRDRARAGYRADYIVSIAREVTAGKLDLEALRPGAHEELDDDEAYARLLELPGVGPYAAAHAMMLVGRYSRPVLDSWSRPAFAEATGAAHDDRAIARHFERFGPFAGLAFWLVVTRTWIA